MSGVFHDRYIILEAPDIEKYDLLIKNLLRNSQLVLT